MKSLKSPSRFSGLDILVLVLFLLFSASLFKHISFPLIWNDESEGVMSAVQVIEHGYPKAHSDKNMIFMPPTPDVNLWYKKKSDVNIYMTWGNYYYAAVGVLLANLTNDIYLKTALIRIPFAAIALAGLVIFMFSFSPFFPNRRSFKLFQIIFLFVELFSVTLVLHMREARYYSLVIFICSCFFYLYTRRVFLKKFSYYTYAILMFLTLTLSFHINFVSFTILIIVYFLHQFILLINQWRSTKNKSDYIGIFKLYAIEAVPVIAAVLISIPFIIFFDFLKTSAAVSEYHNFSFATYQNNISKIIYYFSKLEFLYTALFIKAIAIIMLLNAKGKTPPKNYPLNRALPRLSFLLLIFFIVYALMIARTPYIYVRFLIVLQPVLTLMMLFDLFIIADFAKAYIKKGNATNVLYFLYALILLVFFVNSRNKFDYLKGHIYELTHQYKGPLDYTIPYIKANFKNPEDLIIATNYEEYSYMYYLGSKVIIGYIANNLDEDIKCKPDIIIYRKSWGNFTEVFNNFLRDGNFKKISFPVQDYPVNNIPELDFSIKHQFKTLYASDENAMTDIWIRQK